MQKMGLLGDLYSKGAGVNSLRTSYLGMTAYLVAAAPRATQRLPPLQGEGHHTAPPRPHQLGEIKHPLLNC